jgi:hypothetical protein
MKFSVFWHINCLCAIITTVFLASMEWEAHALMMVRRLDAVSALIVEND